MYKQNEPPIMEYVTALQGIDVHIYKYLNYGHTHRLNLVWVQGWLCHIM